MPYPKKTNKNPIQIYNELKKNPELWDLFTKKEEYFPKKLDEHGRFQFKSSKHKEVLHPTISEYLINQGFKFEYPENKKFAIVLTHDVDDIFVKNKHILLSLFHLPKNRDVNNVVQMFKGRINKEKTPYLNFKKIIEIEKKYDASSSFYFLATSQDIFGVKYNLEDVREKINYLIDENCEIGLHTGYYSYNSLEKIKNEKNKLEKIVGNKILGARNHVLRFRTPESWALLSSAGFGYDTSFGYHDMIGFRNGMCHPFKPYDLNENREIDILEIPLNVQDMTFLMHFKISPKERWQYVKNLIDTVKQFNGVLTILWHNWTFCLPASYGGLFNKEWTKLYEKILNYGYKNDAWLTNCKEVYNLYKK